MRWTGRDREGQGERRDRGVKDGSMEIRESKVIAALFSLISKWATISNGL